jgi:polysaccharide pyruvyl transferase WcaK-like protein
LIRSLASRVLDPDRALMRAMDAAIDAAAVRHALDRGVERYREGEPLKLLLAGYQGRRNTGSDVRVEEMIRQIRAVLGDEHVELAMLSIELERTAGYFRTVRQLKLPSVFPPFLFTESAKHHGVVACEGSMFKSKFANALATMMAGALGLASVEGKLAVGYGAEAGAMDPSLEAFVRRHCKSSLVMCRNEQSRQILEGMGIRTTSGADTAWTFEPAPLARGKEILRAAGWDGAQKLLVVCPINPFWWPAKPDLVKAAAHNLLGEFKSEHYLSIYFNTWSEEAAEKYEAYIGALGEAVHAFAKDRGVFVALVGTELLDRGACEAVARDLETRGTRAPVLVSDELDMYELVSVLRNASLMLSSRFHAMVTSMPAGVPSMGVTMDERITNLLEDRGHSDLLLRVEDDDLGPRILDGLRLLDRDAERVREESLRFVPTQLALMGQMGIDFSDEAQRVYPNLPRRDLPRDPLRHLPPLSADINRLLEAYA